MSDPQTNPTAEPTPEEQGEKRMSEEPQVEDLEEPSTEKEPAEAPRSPDEEEEPEPSHQAVGIGVIDGPASDPQQP